MLSNRDHIYGAVHWKMSLETCNYHQRVDKMMLIRDARCSMKKYCYGYECYGHVDPEQDDVCHASVK